jgi:putative ATPase
MGYFDAVKALSDAAPDDVPNHLKDASRDKKGLGHGKGYKYPHAYREHWVPQQYQPDTMQGSTFYRPGELGYEARVRERVERLRAARAREGGAAPGNDAGPEGPPAEERSEDRAKETE